MANRKPALSEMTRTYESTEDWINQYLLDANGILKSRSINKIRDFRYELWDFLHGIESRWLSQGVWRLWLRGKGILSGYQELRRLELRLARTIEDLKREQIILHGMQKAALPDEGSQPTNVRNAADWNQFPKRYPPIIKRKIKDARLPEHIGD